MASALRLRVAPRTSGITQNAQENEQPSWIFTNARTVEPRVRLHAGDRADVAGDRLDRLLDLAGDDGDVVGSPAKAVSESGRRSRSRRRGRACGARGALPGLREPFVRDAAGVDHRDVAAALDLAVAVADEPLAQRLGVSLRDLAAEETNGEARHRARKLMADVQIRRPATRLDAALPAVALELGLVGDEVAGRDRPARAFGPSATTASAAMFASASSASGSSSSRRSACPPRR